MIQKDDSFVKKLIKKDYNKQLEKVLSDKTYKEDVKNLLQDIMYKIDSSYSDYEKVKQDVISKNDYINIFISIIKDKCDSIQFIASTSKEMKDIDKSIIINKEKKEIKCYPIERKVLYALFEMQKSNNIIKGKNELIDLALIQLLNIGNNINAIEPLRDFNGFSWNISTFEIENLYVNLVYQNLIILVGHDFLEEWINKNDDLVDYLEVFKIELERKYDIEIAQTTVEQLYKIAILLKSENDIEYKSKLLKRKNVIKKNIVIINNKEKYLDQISKNNKNIEKKIKSIDLMLNNNDLLYKRYSRLNKNLPLDKKIFSVRTLEKMIKDEREKLINRLKNNNELMNPNKFNLKCDELKKEYKYLSLIDIDIDSYNEEIYNNIILLQKNILKVILVKIKNANTKNDLLKIIYEIRYLCLIPITEKKQIKDIEEISELIDDVIRNIYVRLCDMKLLVNLTNDDIINISIIKHLCTLQIISLSDVHIRLFKDEEYLHVQYYDEDLADDKFKITIDKEDFKIKINKKIKLFNIIGK